MAKTNSNIIEQTITHVLESNYMPYTMSVIISRAIPEIDGFKPSHRKLLYTMYKMGLLSADKRTKSSNVVGQTMRLNPHGDGAIYETMVRLTEGNGALLHPFVDSKGNFGKQYARDMAYAAARYTEVSLAPICKEVFADIDKETVPFVDNFDGTTKEPVLLPVKFPNILVNPNQGIAVGMASNICSFNLREICETTIRWIDNPDCDLLETLKGPDFSTGGQLIFDEKEIRAIYETGRGSFKIRASYQYDQKNNCIEIFEIPYTTTVEAIIDKIITLVKNGKIREISDIRDETDLKGLKIAIDLKRGTDPDKLMQKLYGATPLSDSFGCNFNVLIDEKPAVLGVKGILAEWIRFRLSSLKKQISYDINKIEAKIHLLHGLSKIILDIDKAIAIIRETESESQVVPRLMQGFSIDEVQADYIAEIKLRNINREFLLKRTQELAALEKELADLKSTLASDAKVHQIIKKQLKEIAKKYGQDRKTALLYEKPETHVFEDDEVADYAVKLFLTEHGYLKKVSVLSYNKANEQKLKEDDCLLQEKDGHNREDLLLFSDRYVVYKLKINDIPDHKASLLGEYLTNLLGLSENEHIVYMTTTQSYQGFMLFVFENGKIAKIGMESYATKMNRKKLVNAYSDKSPLVLMRHLEEEKDVVAMRDFDKASLFNTQLVGLKTTKNSAGVQCFSLKKNSKLTKAWLAEDFVSDNIEHYRTDKIPTAGHFLTESDKSQNKIPLQIKLF